MTMLLQPLPRSKISEDQPMTETKTANEFGKVRVFQLAHQVETDTGRPNDYARLEAALGAKIVNQADVQILSLIHI